MHASIIEHDYDLDHRTRLRLLCLGPKTIDCHVSLLTVTMCICGSLRRRMNFDFLLWLDASGVVNRR